MRIAASLLLVLTAVVSASAAPDAAHPSARDLGNAFSSVYEKVAPGVVVLEVTRQGDMSEADAKVWEFLFQGRQPHLRPHIEKSEGSGFVIREDGYILTNAHVVEGADPRGGVIARRQDGTRMPLTLVGIDDKTDLAVLKADAANLPVVEWGDSDAARVGEFVCSIGTPFDLDYTLTVGVLSAKGRRNLTDAAYEDYLQTDAAINPGNSGGPLCDLDGRVIGVNTLINGLNRGLGFAIPSKLARSVSEELVARGRVIRPWLGVRILTLGEEPLLHSVIGLKKGVLVKTIEPDAPAAHSDLQPADVIVAVDGAEVETARDLQQAVLRKKIGEEVDLKVWRRNLRDGAYRRVSVVTGELPSRPVAAARPPVSRPPVADNGADDAPAVAGEVNWGLELAQPAHAGIIGVRVVAVEPQSSAAVAGMEPGDIVTAVGADAVSDADSFAGAMSRLPAGEPAVLMIERGGRKTYAILKR